MKRINESQRSVGWGLCRATAIVLAMATFTPAVIPMGASSPAFLGLPYTLWVGVAVSLAFLALTIIGVWVHPDGDAMRGADSQPPLNRRVRDGQEPL